MIINIHFLLQNDSLNIQVYYNLVQWMLTHFIFLN